MPPAVIIGCGFIGAKRAHIPGFEILTCCDSVLDRAKKLASSLKNATAVEDWKDGRKTGY